MQPAKAICSSAMGEGVKQSARWDQGFPLTEAQRRAATHEGGPLIVLAGPGSGKTRTLVARAACLAAPVSRGGKGVDPSSILAVTFTVKAAEQLRERLLELAGFQAAERIKASTFHSFGRSIVLRFGDTLDLPASLTVMDSAMRKEALRDAIRQTGALADRAREGFDRLAQEMDDFITAAKRHALDAAACAEGLKQWRASIYADSEAAEAEEAAWRRCSARCAVYKAYEALTLARGWISLEDYMLLAVRILRRSEDVRALVRSDIRHIIVDEFQDVNRSQLELLSLLAPQEDADICVVGDDDQAIYGFRGAEPQAFERFAERWPKHATIKLEANFRSAEAIVRAGDVIISNAATRFDPEKRIHAATPAERMAVGAEPLRETGQLQGVYVDAAADLGEAAALAALVEKQRRPDLPWSSIAVLARNSGNVERAQLALELRGVPCAVAHTSKPVEHPQVKTLIAWLRLAADPADEHHTQRALYEPPLAVEGERIVQWRRAWRSDGA
ncbi:MAG: ATP-dependent helicase, partial [Planctomycetota bacterium]